MRTINYHFDEEDLEAISIMLSAEGVERPLEQLQKAFGYLSTWGMNYPVVDLYLRSRAEGEFTACYRAKPLTEVCYQPAYVIGAIFHPETKQYGFHS